MRSFYGVSNIFAANIVNATNLWAYSQMQVFSSTVIRIRIIKLPQLIIEKKKQSDIAKKRFYRVRYGED